MNRRCSACLTRGHTRATCPNTYTCKPPPRTMRNWSETIALREAIWEQLSFRFAKAPSQIFQAIRDDWGEIDERRLWRALQWTTRYRPVLKRIVEIDVIHQGREMQIETTGYLRRAA